MNYSYFFGIDLGKSSFDACLMSCEGAIIHSFHLPNTPDGYEKLCSALTVDSIKASSILFCAEDMGTYTYDLALFCTSNNFPLCLCCPLSIKKSIGLQRGKNDRIDARRIADYALTHYRKLKLYVLPDPVIVELRACLIIREKLVKQKVTDSRLLETVTEMGRMGNTHKQVQLLKDSLEEVKRKIAELEEIMSVLLQQEAPVSTNYELLTSIKGVGLVNAVVLICVTNNFTKFSDHRKFACYCGVAPFEYSSGTSIRGKTRVSPLAHRNVKVYLTRAALTAVTWEPQMKAYYKRKLEQGKHKAAVINAVRAKIIARCFAVIRRQTPFVAIQA